MTIARAGRTKDDVVKEFRTAEIVDAARRVIGHVGYGGASMERIAREAGLSKGTLYLYFESREALLSVAAARGWTDLTERTRASCRRERGYDAKVRQIVRRAVEYSIENGALFRTVGEVSAAGCGADLDRSATAASEYLAYVAGVLDRGIRAGELRPVNPRRAARLLLSAVAALLEEGENRGSPDPTEDQIDAAIDLFLYGAAAGGKP